MVSSFGWTGQRSNRAPRCPVSGSCSGIWYEAQIRQGRLPALRIDLPGLLIRYRAGDPLRWSPVSRRLQRNDEQDVERTGIEDDLALLELEEVIREHDHIVVCAGRIEI